VRERARRVAYDADGTLVAALFSRSPVAWRADGKRWPLGGPEMIDLVTTPDRARVAMLGRDGWVFALGSPGDSRWSRSPVRLAPTRWRCGPAAR
jgi:hypothetical protein